MRARLKPISDQVVVLFGATSGIGLDTALFMAEKGASLVIAGRDQMAVDQAVERARDHARSRHDTRRINGGLNLEDTIIGVQADAGQWEQVKMVADQAVSTFGRIDTWVHLASVVEYALLEDTSPDEFRQVVDINLVGSAYGVMAALPYMKQQQGGSIILISSVAGRVAFPYQAAYNASKHGIIGMADTLRMELKHEGIPVSVTTILPSSVNTPFFSKARTKLGVEPAPMPPVYDPRLVSQAIVHAAQHPVREIIIGGMGYTLQSVRRVSQPLANAFVKSTGFHMERSDEPKSPQAPDNLYHHVPGHNQVLGEYDPQTRKFSLYTWFSTHPAARIILMGAILGGTAFLGYRAIQARRKQPFLKRVRNQVRDFSKALPEVSLPEVRMPQLRRQPTMRERIFDGVEHGYYAVRDSLPTLRREPTFREKMVHGLGQGYETVRDRLPTLRREPTFREKIVHGIEQGYETVRDRLPHRRQDHWYDALPEVRDRMVHGVEQGYETVRDRLPRRRRPAWYESLPLLSLLPFFRKESRMDGARKQLREAVHSLDEATHRLNKAVRSFSVKDTVKDAVRPERFMRDKQAPRQKEVYYDKRREKLPAGEKEVVYQKVEEKLPSGTKETVFERVEETRKRRS